MPDSMVLSAPELEIVDWDAGGINIYELSGTSFNSAS